MGDEDLNIEYPTHFRECEGCSAVNLLIENMRQKMQKKQAGLPTVNNTVKIVCKMRATGDSAFTAEGIMFAMNELTKHFESVDSSTIVNCPGYSRCMDSENKNGN